MAEPLTRFQESVQNPELWRMDDNEIANYLNSLDDEDYKAFSPEDKMAYVQANRPTYDIKQKTSPRTAEEVRPYLEKYLESAARDYEIDPEFIRGVVNAEHTDKNGNVIPWTWKLESNKGAKSVMQVKDIAQAAVDPERKYNRDDPFDNMELGVKYIKYLADKFGYDPVKVAAAYNGGEGNVRKYGGVPPFEETKKYVTNVMNHLIRTKGADAATGPIGKPGQARVAYAPVAQKEETLAPTGLAETALNALARGGLQALQTGTILLEAVTSGETQKSARQMTEKLAAHAEKFPQPKELEGKSLWDNPELLYDASFLVNTIFETIPSFAATWGTGGVGGLAAKGAAKAYLGKKATEMMLRKAMILGAGFTGGAVGGAMEGTSTYKEVLGKGGTEGQAVLAGTGMGLISAFLNGLSNYKMFDKTLRSRIANFLWKGGFEATTEALEEPAEIIMKIMAGKTGGPYKGPSKEEIMQQLKMALNVVPASFILGGTGASIGGGVDAQARAERKRLEAMAKDVKRVTGGLRDEIKGKTEEGAEPPGDTTPSGEPIPEGGGPTTPPGTEPTTEPTGAESEDVWVEGGDKPRKNPLTGPYVSPDVLEGETYVGTDKNRASIAKVVVGPNGEKMIQYPLGNPQPIGDTKVARIIDQSAAASKWLKQNTARVKPTGKEEADFTLAGDIYEKNPQGSRLAGGKLSKATEQVRSKRTRWETFARWFSAREGGIENISPEDKAKLRSTIKGRTDIKSVDPRIFDVISKIGSEDVYDFLVENFSGQIMDERRGRMVPGWTVSEKTLEQYAEGIFDVLHTLTQLTGKDDIALSNRGAETTVVIDGVPRQKRFGPKMDAEVRQNLMADIKALGLPHPPTTSHPVMPKNIVIKLLNGLTRLVEEAEAKYNSTRSAESRNNLETALRNRAALFVMYNTGFRNTSVVSKLLKNDFKEITDPNTKETAYTVNPAPVKNQARGTYILSPETVHAIKEYLLYRDSGANAEADQLFAGLTESDLNNAIEMGLPKDRRINPDTNKRWTAHSVRKAFATDMSNAGAKKEEVEGLGGWNKDTVDYYIANVGVAKGLIDKYHPISTDPTIIRRGPTGPFEGGGPTGAAPTTPPSAPPSPPTPSQQSSNAFRATESGEIPKAAKANTAGNPAGVMSEWDIIDVIRNKMKQIVFVTRQNIKALGRYFPFSEEMELRREANLRVLGHEMGHAIYRYLFPGTASTRIGLTRTQAFHGWQDAVLSFLSPDMSRRYAPEVQPAEGFAEFMYQWLIRDFPTDADGNADYSRPPLPLGDINSTDPIKRRQAQFSMWFDQTLYNSDPKLHETLTDLTRMYYQYRAQDDYSKGLANMAFGPRRPQDEYMTYKELTNRYLAKFNFFMIDSTDYFRTVEQWVRDNGGRFDPTDGPFMAARLAKGAFANALQWLGMERRGASVPVDMDGKPMKEDGREVLPLKDIINMVSKDKQLDWRYILAVRSAVERQTKSLGVYKIPFTPEEIAAANRVWGENPEFAEAAKELRRYQKAMLHLLVQADLLDEARAEYMLDMFDDFVPLERDISARTGIDFHTRKIVFGGGHGKSMEVSPNIVKRQSMTGSFLPVIDPIETIAKRTVLYTTAAKKHKILSNLVRILYDVDRSVPAPKNENDLRFRYIAQGASQFMTEVFPDVIPFTISREQMVNIFRKYSSQETKTKVKTETRTIVEEIKETIQQGGGVGAITTEGKGANLMRDRLEESLRARGWSDNEAKMMIDRVIAASKVSKEKGDSQEKTEQIVTREIMKISETTRFFEVIKETIFTPPEKHTMFKKDPRKPRGQAGRDMVITVNYKDRHGLRPRHFQINDEHLMDVIQQMQYMAKGDADMFTKAFKEGLRLPAKMLRLGATLNPAFILRNAMRDQWSAFLYNKYGYIPGWDLVKGVGTMLGLTEKQRAQYRMYLASGAANASLTALDRQSVQDMQEALIKQTPTDIAKHIITRPNVFKGTIELLRTVSEGIERGTRIGVFNRAVKNLERQGYVGKEAFMRAALDSREATLDFARAGIHGRAINSYTAFFNANLQGLDKMRREFFSKETRPMVWLKTFISITAPSVLVAYLYHDDPRYKNLQWYWKDLFLCIPLPWSPTHGYFKDALRQYEMDWNQKYNYGRPIIFFDQIPNSKEKKEWLSEAYRKWPVIRLPKPFEPGVIFGSVPERATAMMMDRITGTAEGGTQLSDQIDRYMREGLTETIASVVIPFAIPTALSTPTEVVTNYSSFTGRDIVPMGLEASPNVDQYAHYTTETAKLIARGFDIVQPKILEKVLKLNSPAIIEHYIRNWTGGFGVGVAKFADYLLKEVYEKPFLKKELSGRTWESISREERYRIAEKYRTNNNLGLILKIDPTPTYSDFPVIDGFVARYPSANTQSIRRFYERFKMGMQHEEGMKKISQEELSRAGTIQKWNDLAEKGIVHRALWSRSSALQKASRDFSQILDAINATAYDPRLTAADKALRTDVLYLTLVEASIIANREYEKVRDEIRGRKDLKIKSGE